MKSPTGKAKKNNRRDKLDYLAQVLFPIDEAFDVPTLMADLRHVAAQCSPIQRQRLATFCAVASRAKLAQFAAELREMK